MHARSILPRSPWAGSSHCFGPAISRHTPPLPPFRRLPNRKSPSSRPPSLSARRRNPRRAGHPIHFYRRRRRKSSTSDGAARGAPVGVPTDHGRHHPRRRPRLLRHAPHRDLLQGEDGGEAAEVRSAHARQGEGGAETAGRDAARGPGSALAGLVISIPLAQARFRAVRT